MEKQTYFKEVALTIVDSASPISAEWAGSCVPSDEPILQFKYECYQAEDPRETNVADEVQRQSAAEFPLDQCGLCLFNLDL